HEEEQTIEHFRQILRMTPENQHLYFRADLHYYKHLMNILSVTSLTGPSILEIIAPTLKLYDNAKSIESENCITSNKKLKYHYRTSNCIQKISKQTLNKTVLESVMTLADDVGEIAGDVSWTDQGAANAPIRDERILYDIAVIQKYIRMHNSITTLIEALGI
ncbi:MAG: hypothetical protein ACK5V4_04575, partial [Alphaproteobacteria bacterium]